MFCILKNVRNFFNLYLSESDEHFGDSQVSPFFRQTLLVEVHEQPYYHFLFTFVHKLKRSSNICSLHDQKIKGIEPNIKIWFFNSNFLIFLRAVQTKEKKMFKEILFENQKEYRGY